MNHHTSKGFAAVEALLVIVIVAIIGGTGYFVWHAKQNSDKSLENSANSNQATIKAKKEVVVAPKTGDACALSDGKKGLILEMGDKVFSFCEPNGWKLLHTEVPGAFFASADSITYDVSTPATVESTGGSDNMYAFYAWNKVDTSATNGYTKQSTGKTDVGETLEIYTHVTGDKDPVGAGIDYLPAGTKLYVYLVTKASHKLEFNYIVQPGQVDDNELIKLVASSTK